MSEALRLADALESGVIDRAGTDTLAAATELRRLYALLMDQQGDIYGLNFARETERKIHNLVKVENERLRELLKECKAVMKANSLFRNSITHHELCKRVSAAIKEST